MEKFFCYTTYMDLSYLKFTLPSFIHFDTSLFVNLPVLLIIFVLFLAGYGIVSGVLLYHWRTYGMGTHGISVARILFLLISAVLFVLALLGIIFF